MKALQVYAVETECGNCEDRIRMFPEGIGEKAGVWHLGLLQWGTFVAIDDWETDTAYVDFDRQDAGDEPLRVTRALLRTSRD